MSDYKVTDTQLTSVANAIRAKTGKSAQIEFPTEFVSEIGSIDGGGGGDVEPTLPAEYQEVEYIESTGTQYIKADINWTATICKIVLRMQTDDTANTCPFGNIASNSNSSQVEKRPGSDGLVVRYGFGSQDIMVGSYINGIHILGNEPKAYCFLTKNTDPILGIHAVINSSTGLGEYLFKGIIYRVTLYDCDTDSPTEALAKKYDFVPCYRKSDGEIGYYEAVNGIFYTNQGSGTFGKGANV